MISNKLNGYSINYNPVGVEKQGKQIKLAAIASEDQLFPDHWGVDFKAIKRAYKNNAKGKKIRGGSTITQQTAKNVFLWQGRDYVRKGLELYSSLLIEIIWGKEKILEHYLNIAEMGEGIYGVEAASQHYFGKSANKISAQQAAEIIACLPNPKKMNPAKRTSIFNRRTKHVLRQMKNLAGDKDIQELLGD